jgi:dolichol-phosphate mannosyltransferase
MTSIPLISVIVPCYNEQELVIQSLGKLLSALSEQNLFRYEIIVVDDHSIDQTLLFIRKFAQNQPDVKILEHPINQGKGGALQTGFTAAQGDIIAIHDADLEYDPRDLVKLLLYQLEHSVDIVFGSRLIGKRNAQLGMSPQGYIANHILSLLTRALTGLKTTDMETCYKCIRTPWLHAITLKEKRFGIEPEITCKLARARLNGRKPTFTELPISFYPRTYAEGKKIGIKDGFRALYCILKFSLT